MLLVQLVGVGFFYELWGNVVMSTGMFRFKIFNYLICLNFISGVKIEIIYVWNI